MASPEKRGELMPQGPRPKPKQPRVRPAPIAPEKAREGIAGVRANADATFQELEYQTKVAIGEIPQELMRVHTDALLRLRKTPKKGLRFDREYIVPLYERVRAASRKKKKPLKEAIAKGLDDNRRLLHARQIEAMFVTTGLSVKAGDTQAISEARRKFCEIIPDDLPSTREGQLQIARNVIQQFGSSVDPEYVRTVIIDLGKQEDAVELSEQAFQEEQVAQAFAEQSVATDDLEKAFAEALKKGSPELQKAYEEYLAFWNSESVADVVAPLMPEINGTSVTPLSEVALLNAKQIITDGTGIVLVMKEGNYGTIQFGDFVRGCEFYVIDGEPKLYIDDPNADKGRRGPIDPAEVRAELAHALVDHHFSEEFRKFVGRGSEVDPQKIPDEKLFKIVHKFLPPGSDKHMDQLDVTQRRIISNLAVLFATPDSTYFSLEDKARFLEARIVSQPGRLATACHLLQKKDLTEDDSPYAKLTLTEFASELSIS